MQGEPGFPFRNPSLSATCGWPETTMIEAWYAVLKERCERLAVIW